MKHTIWMTGIALVVMASTTVHAQALNDSRGGDRDTAAALTAVLAPVSVPVAVDSSALVADVPASAAQLNGPVAVQRRSIVAAPASFVVVRRSQGAGKNVAMMVVGGAALITGAVVGGSPGTVIMVGGAVIGLVGLYHYLQ